MLKVTLNATLIRIFLPGSVGHRLDIPGSVSSPSDHLHLSASPENDLFPKQLHPTQVLDHFGHAARAGHLDHGAALLGREELDSHNVPVEAQKIEEALRGDLGHVELIRHGHRTRNGIHIPPNGILTGGKSTDHAKAWRKQHFHSMRKSR